MRSALAAKVACSLAPGGQATEDWPKLQPLLVNEFLSNMFGSLPSITWPAYRMNDSILCLEVCRKRAIQKLYSALLLAIDTLPDIILCCSSVRFSRRLEP